MGKLETNCSVTPDETESDNCRWRQAVGTWNYPVSASLKVGQPGLWPLCEIAPPLNTPDQEIEPKYNQASGPELTSTCKNKNGGTSWWDREARRQIRTVGPSAG